MRILVDANALLWAMESPAHLSPRAVAEIDDPANDLFVGAGTFWEIAIKVGIGKLTLSAPYRPWMDAAVLYLDLSVLPITLEHADVQAGLPRHHGDPFDRLLVAQASHENMGLISADGQLDAYGVHRIW